MKDSYFLMAFFDEPENHQNPKPHVTFLAHMTLKEDESHSTEELVRRIHGICKNTSSFSLPYSGKERFGVHNEHVVLICEDPNKEAANLHNTLLGEVSSLVDFGQPQYTGKNFKPHVTWDEEHHNAPKAQVNSLTLVCNENGYGSGLIHIVGKFGLNS